MITRRLLFIVNVDWFFISHRIAIARKAINEGYEVHIAVGITDNTLKAVLEDSGLIVHPIVLDRTGVSISNTFVALRQIWNVFDLIRPDIVHFVTIKPVLLGGILARLAGVSAVVLAISGLGFVFVAQGNKAALRRNLVGLLYRIALGHHNAKVIFQNQDDHAILSSIVSLPDSKVEMIRGSGVDLTEYKILPLPLGIPVVLFAARLLVDKGVREFIEAARLLKRRAHTVRFIIVGNIDPDNPSSLKNSDLADWTEEGVVEVWGHHSDMPQVLAASHIVVLPSYYGEGLPKVLIEAAACGRAVVTTDHPGCRDAIEKNVTGLLVPVRDALSLANAIELLLNDPQLCQTMGQAGRVLAEREFDVQNVVESHMRIYKELLISGK